MDIARSVYQEGVEAEEASDYNQAYECYTLAAHSGISDGHVRAGLCCLSGRTLSRGTLRFIDFAKKWRIRKGLSAHAGREE